MLLKPSSRGDHRLPGRDLSWTWSWLSVFRQKSKERASGSWRFVFFALSFLIPLGGIVVTAAIGVAMTAGAGGGGGHRPLRYAVLLAFLTWTPFALGVVAVRESRSKAQLVASIMICAVFLLPALVSVIGLLDYIAL